MTPQLKAKLESLPKEPGVYLMKDEHNRIIYVGKAKSLRARVTSYFHSTANHTPKTILMVKQIHDLEVMLVDTEIGALLLERTLIKHHQPQYNIRLTDDKEYPYLRIDYNSTWPRIRKVRKRKNDGATYLGPYGNAVYLNTLLQLTNRVFPLIKCSQYEFENTKRPCNYYHMRMCLGPCTLPVQREVYLDVVQSAAAFLQGKNKDLIKDLTNKMKAAAEREEYEIAATYRDQIEAFKHISQQKTVIANDIKDADVIGYAQSGDIAALHLLMIREGLVTGNDSFVIKIPIQDGQEALQEFLLQYYDNKFVPEEICLPFPIPDTKEMEQLLVHVDDSKRALSISVPLRGTKKRLIEMAEKNAQFSLGEALQHQASRRVGLELLQARIGLSRFPRTIECIDISNIQGTAIVASNVCFVDGKPAKELYRLYHLADQADNPDDFASIREVMLRRLKRGRTERDLPDLFVIDGGKGQLSAAWSAAEEFPDLEINLISLAKSRIIDDSEGGDGFSRVSVEHSNERIFLPDQDRGLDLELGSPEYRILTQLRDEAHRFAITYHRKRRKKILQSSSLDSIPGIGPALKKKLFEHFTDLAGIRSASLDQLRGITGMREATATALYSHFRHLEEQENETT